MAECREWQEEISAFLDGELAPEKEPALWAHLAECEECSAAMALLRSVTQVMREDAVQPPEKLAEGARYLFEQEKKSRGFSLKRWRFTAIAAVLCLALLGVVKLAPWRAGSRTETAAAPLLMNGIVAQEDVKAPAPASAQAGKDSLIQAGGAEPAPESSEANVEAPAEAPAQADEMQSEPAPAATAYRSAAQTDNGSTEPDGMRTEEQQPAENGALPGSSAQVYPNIYTAATLPGYAIYSQLEGAANYYCVCFVYGAVPETIRTNRECTPLDAPEGQERWLVPYDVCVNEGLLEQFSEIYYGDLLSRQGLVIGIPDMEEDQWQP